MSKKKDKKEKKAKSQLKKDKKRSRHINGFNITDDKFITISSIMDSITREEVSGKKSDYYYYTKSGKIKKFRPKKEDKLIISIEGNLHLYEGSVYGVGVKECDITDNGSYFESGVRKYEIPFKKFAKALKGYMLDDKYNDSLIVKADPDSKDGVFVLSSCKKIGYLIDKENKAYLTVRYDI